MLDLIEIVYGKIIIPVVVTLRANAFYCKDRKSDDFTHSAKGELITT